MIYWRRIFIAIYFDLENDKTALLIMASGKEVHRMIVSYQKPLHSKIK